MKDLLNKLLPTKPKQGGALPKYSAKKRNKLITFGILAAVAVTAGVYLFITFNPLKSSVTTLAETPDIAFSQLHKYIKTGNRKEIIARMSKKFKGGAVQKRAVINAFGSLKGISYKIKKDVSTSKGDIHVFTYSITVNNKSVTLSDERWQRNPEENKWYLLQEGKNFQQLASLTSEGEVNKDDTGTSSQVFYEIEKAIPEGASLLTSIKNVESSFQKVKNTAFYAELIKVVTKKAVSKAELTLVETAITSLFGENVVYANYGNSHNYLAVSKVSGSIKFLSPIVENILKVADKKIKITSSKAGNTTIKTVVSGKNKAFYAFSETFLHISDSELLLKNSLQLAEKKKEDSILNNTDIFTFLTGLRSDYKYYVIGSYSNKTSPDYFNYGYMEGDAIRSRTSTKKDAELSQWFIANNKNTFNGTESLFDILPDDIYGFLALTLDAITSGTAEKDSTIATAIKAFEDGSGLKVQKTFTNKILLTILSGSGTSINDFFFPVVIAETKPNMAEKTLNAIANKYNLEIKTEEENKYFLFNVAPQMDIIVSAISNNLVIAMGMSGFKKVLSTSTNKYPNIKSNDKWNYFFGDKVTAKLIYSFNIDAFSQSITEIYARSNVNPLKSQQITKLDTIDVLHLLGGIRNVSGKLQVADGALVDKGSLVFGDIDPTTLRAQSANYMKKSDLDIQSLLSSQGVKFMSSGTSTRLSSGVVSERKIEGFVYRSRRIRDPFAASYLISQMDYEKEVKGKREAESLYKEIEQESIRLEKQFLKPIVFNALILDVVKTNGPVEYQKIVKYAKLFKNGGSLNIDTFEKHKKDIFAYNDLFNALMSKYEGNYLDKNKLPHHSLKSLKLKGIATGSLGSKALIVAGDRGYFIAEGDYISSDFYLVEKISNGNVQLVKKSFNYKLSPTTQQQTLSISK